MTAHSKLVQEIHIQAKEVVKAYKKCESDLIQILIRAEEHRVHQHFKCRSLYKYAIDELELSEDVAYIFINVARKVREVPTLGVLIREGKITVSKAKRISPVLNQKNQSHWLHLAQTSSKRELEKLVTTENPKAAIVERATFVSRERLNLQVGVSEKFMLSLRRAQDVLSQKRRRPVSLEETLESAVGLFLNNEDPLVIAQRQKIKGRLVEIERPERNSKADVVGAQVGIEKNEVSNQALGPGPAGRAPEYNHQASIKNVSGKKRSPIPASTKHRVQIKFQGQCGHVDHQGRRCEQGRFLEVHHIKPVSEGGSDEFTNLELLCWAHHRARHHDRPL